MGLSGLFVWPGGSGRPPGSSGIGSVVGSTLAAILLAAIGSSLIFLSVSPYWIKAVQGVLILVTVLADLWRRRQVAH